MTLAATPSLHYQRGFSFFEVLVAGLILGIGVLGFASLQLRALDSTGVAHFRAQAMVLAADMVERIRLAEDGIDVDHADYENNDLWDLAVTKIPETAPTSWTRGNGTCYASELAGAVCGEANWVLADAMEIQYMARELLPSGNVSVRPCTVGAALTCVFVAWRGQDSRDCDIDAPEEDCVVAQVLF